MSQPLRGSCTAQKIARLPKESGGVGLSDAESDRILSLKLAMREEGASTLVDAQQDLLGGRAAASMMEADEI